jgi:hypothetical protein
MHRYRPPTIPRHSHLRYFNLLTEGEKARSVRRLIQSGHTTQRVADLTGLPVTRIEAILAEREYWRDAPR